MLQLFHHFPSRIFSRLTVAGILLQVATVQSPHSIT